MNRRNKMNRELVIMEFVAMSCKVRTTREERAAYFIAAFVFLVSLFVAGWNLVVK